VNAWQSILEYACQGKERFDIEGLINLVIYLFISKLLILFDYYYFIFGFLLNYTAFIIIINIIIVIIIVIKFC
jgi:hypothetical protein